MTSRNSLLAGVAALAVMGASAGAVLGGFASAQDAPESLLPPGFDDPAPAPTPTPRPTAAPTAAPAAPSAAPAGSPATVQPLPQGPAAPPSVPALSEGELSRLPTLEELENLSTDELDDLLGLKPEYDIPPAARRSLAEVGVLAPEEGGMPVASLAAQPAELVRPVLAGTRSPMVSRWGHILLRRTLASRLAAPDGLDPVQFAALRVGILNRIGEFALARALVQDIDTGNWNRALTSQALTAYLATADIVGACPAVRLQGNQRENPEWVMWQAICNAYAGEGALAASQLNTAQSRAIAPEIDIALAQRFAGASGRGRGGVTVNWDGVDTINTWRFALANAVGETLPEGALDEAIAGRGGAYYALSAAQTPMLAPHERADHAEFAAARGVLSSAALVDLYSQIYAGDAARSDVSDRAARLREAYVGADPEARLAAMRGLWGEGDRGFAGQVLTAYAAARIPPSPEYSGDAGALIASMLAAGLDRDAASWRGAVDEGTLGWALIALADPEGGSVASSDIRSFEDADESAEGRKTAFLVAGLAGLGRMAMSETGEFGVDLTRRSRWTRTISAAADAGSPALVALLAGLGMQGESWSQMTPLHLFHITAALRRAGLEAEARMIAAEAVARG
ncbi:hypothetical protein [Qipengyuania nanhaisediminis]|uniref:hypothetical protein n=1 Tax=Qipengyuania nanhaisediminis TaxID=604088 RepID=UPI0038B246B1